jgi:ubiquinone/menaquinone biosynthesis C-methylase UbiE
VPQETYTHGHHESVLRAHRWRTAENSAGYLLPYLRPGLDLLDVGCGPGTITNDFARLVAPGRVVGVDNADAPLKATRVQDGPANLEFRSGDAYELPFADHCFDIVHAHQVLQHLKDPVAALRGMRRVCRPGGIVAARDADYAAMTWFPQLPGLDVWLELYQRIARSNDAEPDAARRLLSWCRAAGFDDVTATASAWCFASAEERDWWAGLWRDRVRMSSFATQAVERGFATEQTLDSIAQAWVDWAAAPDAWFAILNGEVVCRA